MKLGDVSDDLALFKEPATSIFDPAILQIAMYSMHIINSLLKHGWDVVKRFAGTYEESSKKMNSNQEAIDQIIAALTAKKQGKHLNRNQMNGRDWRALFAQEWEAMKDSNDITMMSCTAVALKRALEYISWLGNTTDDVSDSHIAVMDCACHILDVTLQALDPTHNARHEAKDHFHVAIHHFAQRMTETRVPFRISEEGVFEAHLKTFEKKWMQAISFRDLNTGLKRMATFADINTEASIKHWLTRSETKDALKPPHLQSFLFLPCCFTTTLQRRTMVLRVNSTIAYFPQEKFWTWASTATGKGMVVRMQHELGGSNITPICLCDGSKHTPFLQCAWMQPKQQVMDLVSSLKFEGMRTFIDNLGVCGESKKNQAEQLRQNEIREAKEQAKDHKALEQIQTDQEQKKRERKTVQAGQKARRRPLEQRFARLEQQTTALLLLRRSRLSNKKRN
jgi:hypothetical protein